jgi:hypothetical protein
MEGGAAAARRWLSLQKRTGGGQREEAKADVEAGMAGGALGGHYPPRAAAHAPARWGQLRSCEEDELAY